MSPHMVSDGTQLHTTAATPIAPTTSETTPISRLTSCKGSAAAAAAVVTRDEVSQHNKKGDAWIIINEDVFDISTFSKRHPGGASVIMSHAGADATDAYDAFHKNREYTDKFMKCLKVGRLPTSEKEGTPIEEDFRKLRRKFSSEGLFEPSYMWYTMQLLHIYGMEAMAWVLLYWATTTDNYNWLVWIIAGVLLSEVQSQAGWLQHDCGHLALFKKWETNIYAHWFVICHIKGASATWWNRRHSRHHAKPNCLDKDPDVNLANVFLLGRENAKRVGSKKQGMLPYNWQQNYFVAMGPPIMLPLFFHYDNIRYVLRHGRYTEFFAMMTCYVRYFLLFTPLIGFGAAWKLYMLIRVLEAHQFVWVTQMNHIPMDIRKDVGRDWPVQQLYATCNVTPSLFNDWFTGHLNYQIEHHLFPTMPRHNYSKITKEVQAFYKRHGLENEFIVKPLMRAFQDVVYSFKDYGRIWKEAYDLA